eukprot:CAMPEP_0176167218 /NCGR_PEP_ID=MMETSP0120_2-20121206/85546_1 /TAXON_ID=160619 /ORGANISM="Kryptoperidinium foliaceum, Strain CCMP 1326" /LENGTH=46 /DNA_ID= /DNA_START= /DNA_END= /DNA_ORIENTATION=
MCVRASGRTSDIRGAMGESGSGGPTAAGGAKVDGGTNDAAGAVIGL